MKRIGHKSYQEAWGNYYNDCVDILGSMIEEDYETADSRRRKFLNRAKAAVAELEQIHLEMKVKQ